MKTRLLTVALAAAISPASYSAIISHSGYSLDTDTNIVTGGGLEWLQWDETDGLSINQAVSTYSSDGWRIATLGEMVGLFNTFFEPNFVAVENNTRQESIGAAATGLLDTPAYDDFVTIFGATFVPASNVEGLDPYRLTEAHFGTDDNNNGSYGRAQVAGDYQQNNGVDLDALAWLYGEISTSTLNTGSSGIGVALVRETSAVPVPAAAWLFGSALAGLMTWRKSR